MEEWTILQGELLGKFCGDPHPPKMETNTWFTVAADEKESLSMPSVQSAG